MASVVSAQADVFNMGSGDTSLSFVTVGNPGNAADPTPTNPPTGSLYGAVSYSYNIGKSNVTAAQYAVFLNAVATTDPYGLYYPSMATVGGGSYGCGIVRSGVAGSYTYTVAASYQNFPVNYISLGRCGPLLQLAAERPA